MIFVRVLIRAYQIFLSPLLSFLCGPVAGCRFEPTCSHYFLEACETHGVARGSWLGLKRLARCQPWGGHGFDPVPEKKLPMCDCRLPIDANAKSGSFEIANRQSPIGNS